MARVRLNGWKRLWVVLSILIGFWFVLLGTENIPTRQKLMDNYDATHPWVKYGVAVDPVLREKERVAEVTYKASVDNLVRDQFTVIATTFAQWIATCGALYISGWAVGWIYRGFRPKNNNGA